MHRFATTPDAMRLRLAALTYVFASLVALRAGMQLADPSWPSAAMLQALSLFGVVALCVIYWLPRCHPHARFGAANGVTLARATMACALAGLIGHPDMLHQLGWLITAMAGIALLLDGVDGWLARRYGTMSKFGARFDMETDAATILVLAILVFESGKAGVWILLAGSLRYLFVLASFALPRLAAPLPPSRRRQIICVAQVGALAACTAPVVGNYTSNAIAGLALTLLIASFAIDTLWLMHPERVSRPEKNLGTPRKTHEPT